VVEQTEWLAKAWSVGVGQLIPKYLLLRSKIAYGAYENQHIVLRDKT